ncbi:TetR/AcrR family transcriptional regulator [Nonomuraea typhae]|uniref:TetR/AcrR family transcriptional regulator n=1 Tax=Nonomuraea typhae TaxID=2603600 RepID=A0ABW7ZEA6_9ACTN
MSDHSVSTQATAKRAQILQAAVRLITRDGLGQVKSSIVAREAGVSVGLVHYHFATLDVLIREAFMFADAITLRAMADAAQEAESGREEIELRLFTWLERSEEFEQAWKIWGEFWHAARQQGDIRTLLHTLWDEWLQLIIEVVDRGKQDGSIPARVQSSDAARRLAALLESLGQQLTTGLVTVGDARRLLRGAMDMEFQQ